MLTKDWVIAQIRLWTGGEQVINPVGKIDMFGGATAPSGYLLCDGTAVSRTTYAALFAVLSTKYGVGDGSTTFELPDMGGRYAVGATDADADRGTTAGTALTTGENREVGQHDHEFTGDLLGNHGHTGTFGSSTHTHTSANHSHPLSDSGGAKVQGSTTGFRFQHTAAGPSWNAQTVVKADTLTTSTVTRNSTGLVGDTDATTPSATGTPSATASVAATSAGTPSGEIDNAGTTAGTNAPYVQVNYIIKT